MARKGVKMKPSTKANKLFSTILKIFAITSLTLGIFALMFSCKTTPKPNPGPKPTDPDLTQLKVPNGTIDKNFSLDRKIGNFDVTYEITKGQNAATIKDGYTIEVVQQDEDVEVTLKAIAGSVSKEFTFTVAKKGTQPQPEPETPEKLLKKLKPLPKTIDADLELTKEIEGKTVNWTSSRPDILKIEDGKAKYTAPESTTEVTLTAEIEGKTREFKVNVQGSKVRITFANPKSQVQDDIPALEVARNSNVELSQLPKEDKYDSVERGEFLYWQIRKGNKLEPVTEDNLKNLTHDLKLVAKTAAKGTHRVVFKGRDGQEIYRGTSKNGKPVELKDVDFNTLLNLKENETLRWLPEDQFNSLTQATVFTPEITVQTKKINLTFYDKDNTTELRKLEAFPGKFELSQYEDLFKEKNVQYDFRGWLNKQTNEPADINKLTEDTELVPNIVEYTVLDVTFKNEDATDLAKLQVRKNFNSTDKELKQWNAHFTARDSRIPKVPTKEFHTAKWSQTFPHDFTENTVITPVYTEHKKITYRFFIGSAEHKVEGHVGQPVTPPAIPAKPGYEQQWVFKDTGKALGENAKFVKTHDGKIFEVKETLIKYTLTYKSGDTTIQTKEFDVTTDEFDLMAFPNTPGKIFEGWYKEADFQTQITKIEKGTVGDITVYAKLKDFRPTVKFTFTDGRQEETKQYAYGEKIQYPALSTTPGYDFKWSEMPENAEKDITISEVKTLHTYSITYQGLEGAQNSPDNTATYTVENKVEFKPAFKEKHHFKRWIDTETNEEIKSTDGKSKDLTLRAEFEESNFTAKLEVVNQNTVTLTFTEDATLEAAIADSKSVLDGLDIADAFDLNKIKITYANKVMTITFEEGFVKADYVKRLSYTEGDGSGVIYSRFMIKAVNIKNAAMMTLPEVPAFYLKSSVLEGDSPKWDKVPQNIALSQEQKDKEAQPNPLKHELTLKYNTKAHGMQEEKKEFIHNSKITDELLAPKDMPGYRFVGWYKEDTFTTKVEAADLTDTKDAITLHAKFELITFKIEYVINSKIGQVANTNPTTYTVESEDITFTALPNGKGYTFKGWDIAKIKKGSVGDKVITANIEITQYKAYLDGSSMSRFSYNSAKSALGEVKEENGEHFVNFNYFDGLELKQVIDIREGYTFEHWSLTKRGTAEPYAKIENNKIGANQIDYDINLTISQKESYLDFGQLHTKAGSFLAKVTQISDVKEINGAEGKKGEFVDLAVTDKTGKYLVVQVMKDFAAKIGDIVILDFDKDIFKNTKYSHIEIHGFEGQDYVYYENSDIRKYTGTETIDPVAATQVADLNALWDAETGTLVSINSQVIKKIGEKYYLQIDSRKKIELVVLNDAAKALLADGKAVNIKDAVYRYFKNSRGLFILSQTGLELDLEYEKNQTRASLQADLKAFFDLKSELRSRDEVKLPQELHGQKLTWTYSPADILDGDDKVKTDENLDGTKVKFTATVAEGVLKDEVFEYEVTYKYLKEGEVNPEKTATFEFNNKKLKENTVNGISATLAIKGKTYNYEKGIKLAAKSGSGSVEITFAGYKVKSITVVFGSSNAKPGSGNVNGNKIDGEGKDKDITKTFAFADAVEKITITADKNQPLYISSFTVVVVPA